MLRGVVLGQGEIPICAITAPANPVVITSTRLLWRSNARLNCVRLDELVSVEAPERLQTKKMEMSKLLITTHSGKKHLVETAPGKTLFVIWNVLLQFARRHHVEQNQQR